MTCKQVMLKLFIWRMFRHADTRCWLLMQVACGVVIAAGACLGRVIGSNASAMLAAIQDRPQVDRT
jgi:hypothetical protein